MFAYSRLFSGTGMYHRGRYFGITLSSFELLRNSCLAAILIALELKAVQQPPWILRNTSKLQLQMPFGWSWRITIWSMNFGKEAQTNDPTKEPESELLEDARYSKLAAQGSESAG